MDQKIPFRSDIIRNVKLGSNETNIPADVAGRSCVSGTRQKMMNPGMNIRQV